MTYQLLSQFAQTGGLLYFVAMFLAVVAYALWPRNGGRFAAAARMPLSED